MRYCDWDEVLDRDGLLILTEEALTTSQAEPGTPETAGGRGGLRGAGAGTDELPGRGRRGGGALPLFRRHRRHGG